jgi:Zn-dependent protease with chaperone function
VLYPVFLVVLLASIASIFAPPGKWIWAWVGIVAVVHVVSCTGVVYALARPLGLAWPARETVRRAVGRAQNDDPTDVRQVDELAWLMPNAVALPLQGIVAFTKVAADEMTEDELHAIALHELGHLREPPLVRWMRPVRGLLFLPMSVAIPLIEGDHSLGFLVLLAFTVVFALATRGFSRRHEAKADAHGAAHSPAYARSLEKLHRLAGIPAVVSKHATHPSLYDRMLEAGVTPDFPRPRAPRQFRPLLALAPAPFLAVAFVVIGFSLKSASFVGDPERAALLSVAIHGTPEDLIALAQETKNPRLAELLYERAVREDPQLAPAP